MWLLCLFDNYHLIKWLRVQCSEQPSYMVGNLRWGRSTRPEPSGGLFLRSLWYLLMMRRSEHDAFRIEDKIKDWKYQTTRFKPCLRVQLSGMFTIYYYISIKTLQNIKFRVWVCQAIVTGFVSARGLIRRLRLIREIRVVGYSFADILL
jgi:hypothetical protein